MQIFLDRGGHFLKLWVFICNSQNCGGLFENFENCGVLLKIFNNKKSTVGFWFKPFS